MNVHREILLFGFLCIYLNLSNAQHDGGKLSADSAVKIRNEISSLGRKMFTYLASVSATNENLLISPLNIYHALTFLHMAAGGSTLEEISDLMGIPSGGNHSKSEIHSLLSNFYQTIITSDQSSVILNIANALFLKDGLQLKVDFLDNATKLYQAHIEGVNFGRGKGALDMINRWVSDETKGRITEVADDSMNPDTEALIISILYFDGKWCNQLDEASTKEDKFFIGEEQVDVQMMNLIKRMPYVNNEELQFESVDLLYGEMNGASEYALNIILPKPNQTIENLLPNLKDISVSHIMEKKNEVVVEVKLPKIKFNYFKSLVPVLKYFGVSQTFTRANLQELTDISLRVSEILHGAEIEINEEGTTIATTTTSLHRDQRVGLLPIVDPIPFHVTRPFIINIYNHKNSLTLFSGIVYQPET